MPRRAPSLVVAEAPPPADLDEEYPAYVPPPYLFPTPMSQRLLELWRELTLTPGRAALAVLTVLAVIVAAFALLPVTIVSADAAGPYRAHCGIAYYVAGYPTAAVDAACHSAYGSHAAVFFLAVLVLVVSLGSLALLVAAGRAPEGSRPWAGRVLSFIRRQLSTPARAALFTFDAVALLTAVVALRTVSVPTVDAQGPLVAHCGIGYYVFGTGDSPVQKACRGVYGGHAAVFFLAAGLFVLGMIGLRRLPVGAGADRSAAS